MGKGGRAEMRVLVVYGSESGTAKRGIEKLVKKWKDGNDALTFVKVMEGNEASSLIQSGELKEMADALIVATCVLPLWHRGRAALPPSPAELFPPSPAPIVPAGRALLLSLSRL